MTLGQHLSIRNCIEADGLEYAMVHESNWSHVEDDHFHSLRKKFIEARKELLVYLEVQP